MEIPGLMELIGTLRRLNEGGTCGETPTDGFTQFANRLEALGRGLAYAVTLPLDGHYQSVAPTRGLDINPVLNPPEAWAVKFAERLNGNKPLRIIDFRSPRPGRYTIAVDNHPPIRYNAK